MKTGYKITDVKREKKIGIAADCLSELLEKASKKFGVNVDVPGDSQGDGVGTCKLYVASDGTAVEDDDYLATLPAQTVLVLVKQGETMMNDSNYLYDLIRSTNAEYITAGKDANEFLSSNIKEKFRVLQKYISKAGDGNTHLSNKKDDPDWFQGLEPSEKTKEMSMTKRTKERMRGYLYKTKSALQNSPTYVYSKNGLGKMLIDKFVNDIKGLLELNKYNGAYFNRSAPKQERMCNEAGLFECGGKWSSAQCEYKGNHTINPYRSREERIIFQTWNLDHQIELSRAIIPKIVEAVDAVCQKTAKCDECQNKGKESVVAADKYYLQIFTKQNLKLVHIVCHHKGRHELNSAVHVLCKKCYNTYSQ